MGELKWSGDEFLERLERAVVAGMVRDVYENFVIYVSDVLTRAASPPASSPGESPHYVRGTSDPASLVNSLMLWALPSECRIIVGSTSAAALALEMGSATMQARPWLTPSLIDQMGALEQHLGESIGDSLDADEPMPLENVNLNPLTVEGSAIPSSVPAGKSNVLPNR